jgi:hypothetical protein
LNAAEDELVNVDILGQEKLEKDKKTKAQKTLYDVYDEEAARSLLPQYDDEKKEEGSSNCAA